MTLSDSLATTLRSERERRGLSAAGLAARADVSRAMIGKIERGEAQPTAVLLAKLSAALGMTLSQLVAAAEGEPGRLSRRAGQPVWTDPETGYTRRAVSAPGAPVELAEIELPAGAIVAYAAGQYTHGHQQIVVLGGRLGVREGAEEHQLAVGDRLVLGPPADRTYAALGHRPCRYLVALVTVTGT